MDNFQKVVDALAVNNAEEKERDSNLNRNIASLRASNKEAFSDFITSQQQNTKVSQELVDSQSSNKAAEIETSKEFSAMKSKFDGLLEEVKKLNTEMENKGMTWSAQQSVGWTQYW